MYYLHLHTDTSPTELPRAAPPSSRRGCAETLGDPYFKIVPLPRIQGYRELDREARSAQLANMVYDQHWCDVLQRNSVLLSRTLARQPNYASNAIRRQLNKPYRDQ